MRFVADTMLEKLARWLRILGCDVIYDKHKNLRELAKIADNENRIFITRRKNFPDGFKVNSLFNIPSEIFEVQLKIVVDHFQIDYTKSLFSRCTRCNELVTKVEKELVRERVPVMSWQGFQDFYECPICKKVFWKGAHLKNTLKKIQKILR